ncbi:MAG: hypothetical protein QOE33_3453 [Acidobacteriota bacterium]|nr:hypothetical protein [Acidobacteriota bacterium]
MRHNFTSLIFSSTPLAAFAASLLIRRRWSFVASACLVASAALWLAFGVRPAFVAATLGVVAWFWDERNRLRPLVIEAERERLRASGEEDLDGGNEDFEEFDDEELCRTDNDAGTRNE